ncbi:MAG: sugar-binding domain-containing protein, partial [Novosphingobium sp.]
MTPLSDGWRFLFGEAPDGVTGADFDDREWQPVSLPHSWNRMGNYTAHRAESTDVRQGTGWYRLQLDKPVPAKGKRAILQFDGVGAIADLWVNGQHVGQHKGAFSRFRFDITDVLKPGRSNIIVVRADNSKPEQGSSTEHVIPL